MSATLVRSLLHLLLLGTLGLPLRALAQASRPVAARMLMLPGTQQLRLQLPPAPAAPLVLRGPALARAPEPLAAPGLVVYVQQAETGRPAAQPVLGQWVRRPGSLAFVPAFPFAEGVTYEVQVAPALTGATAPVVRTFQFDKPVLPVPAVRAVYPSGAWLPKNVLRFYVCFTQPMRRQVSAQFVQLRDLADGSLSGAFVNFEEELWSPDSRRLTLLLDPSRIKRGVAHSGPGLQAGHAYELVIAAGWSSAGGMPTTTSFRKTFRVGPAERRTLDAATWQLTAPAASQQPVQLHFDRPLDRALLESRLTVVDAQGRAVAGESVVASGEQGWQFVPRRPWRAGRHYVVVAADLEDACGNQLGEALDHEVGTTGTLPGPYRLPFASAPPTR